MADRHVRELVEPVTGTGATRNGEKDSMTMTQESEMRSAVTGVDLSIEMTDQELADLVRTVRDRTWALDAAGHKLAARFVREELLQQLVREFAPYEVWIEADYQFGDDSLSEGAREFQQLVESGSIGWAEGLPTGSPMLDGPVSTATTIDVAPDVDIDLEWVQRSTAAALTRDQVAKLLGVDPRTVTNAVQRGDLPSIKVGRRVLIPRLPLLAMLGAATGGE